MGGYTQGQHSDPVDAGETTAARLQRPEALGGTTAAVEELGAKVDGGIRVQTQERDKQKTTGKSQRLKS